MREEGKRITKLMKGVEWIEEKRRLLLLLPARPEKM